MIRLPVEGRDVTLGSLYSYPHGEFFDGSRYAGAFLVSLSQLLYGIKTPMIYDKFFPCMEAILMP